MTNFVEKYQDFLKDFGLGRHMVLSTIRNNMVSSRMMSIVSVAGSFYFQTDKISRKYLQLIQHPQIALCADNISIEGVCVEIGRPKNCLEFCNVYEKVFHSSFEKYTFLNNERLFKIKPMRVERWRYIDGMPHVEVFNVDEQQYTLTAYKGS